MSTDYAFSLGNIFTAHAPGRVWALHDAEHRQEIHSQVLSGNFFIYLATKLNLVAANLEMQQHLDAGDLNAIIKDLFYLDNSYQIVPKNKS